MISQFITALQFLTVLRIKKDHQVDEQSLARSMVYFPAVGFLIGVVLVYADKALLVFMPDTLANILLLALLAVLTRGLHLDGLADTIDGLAGGQDREARLRIMRDSRIGSAGALAILFIVLFKYVALNNLFNEYKTSALLTAPVIGRWSQMLMMFRARYARENGMGKAFVGHVRLDGLLVASLFALGLFAFVIVRDAFSALQAVGIALSVAILTVAWRRYINRRLGGATGDAVGAVNELSEALTLLLFVSLMNGR